MENGVATLLPNELALDETDVEERKAIINRIGRNKMFLAEKVETMESNNLSQGLIDRLLS